MHIETLKIFNREQLQNILLKVVDILTEEQLLALEEFIQETENDIYGAEVIAMPTRMSQEFVTEKMNQIEQWMHQIDEGELHLDCEGYEDYSNGYWDDEYITEYYDNCGVGDKITSIVRFAKECVDDRKYKEANILYEWLWEMVVMTDEEFGDPLNLEMLIEEKIVCEDIKQLTLLALYTDYQVKKAEKRAEDIYLYFSLNAFKNLHIEDMFHVGREKLTGIEQFWKDWICLLQTKTGDTESRLLKEAVLYTQGVQGLEKMAEENCDVHPSLYLAAMKEYDRNHDYSKIEKIGERAIDKIEQSLVVRGKIAMKAAYAASCLNHTDKVMLFCWEAFQSDSTERNLLRLFGTKKMAELYGIRCKEVRKKRIHEPSDRFTRENELRRNIIGETSYYNLCFYTGDFKATKEATKNPEGSLGWSSCYVGKGVRLFLLYLYETPLPSKVAQSIANAIGFSDCSDSENIMNFESEIMEESRKYKTSIFWNYFQRWKQYYPMNQEERKDYLSWVEKIVYSRADAIVGGQHRRQYAEVAVLLAMVAEVKEQMGEIGARKKVFDDYKSKFPRHSSFQAEMKNYFGIWQ